MGYRGDLAVPPFWSQTTIRMSTAIMLAYSPEGFVIAADGLRKNSEDPTDFILTAPKIFNLSDQQNRIACAISGVVQYTDPRSGEVVFDLNQEVLQSAAVLRGRRVKNLVGYAVRLSRAVNNRLRFAASQGLIADFEGTSLEQAPEVRDIAFLLLAGYCGLVPEIVRISFQHENQKLRAAKLFGQRASSGTLLQIGSPEIFRLLFQTDDPRLASYRSYDARNETMAEQIRICTSYICACCDSEAIKIDPTCTGIGGHLHVATIRAGTGFHWEIPPLNSDNQP